MQIPETIKKLPESCIIISYDAEACHPSKAPVLPGSTMSIGAVYAEWRPDADPFEYEHYNQRTFFYSMETTIPMDPDSAAFWNRYPKAKAWSTNERATPADRAMWAFISWVVRLTRQSCLPAVLVAQPHSYDVQHLMHNLEMGRSTISNAKIMEFLEKTLFADCAELYSHHHGLPAKEGKTEFKDLFMPKNLVHHPVFDGMVQLNALFAGLLYQRSTTAA